MNTDKLSRWAKEIYENAAAHGWHEEKHSPEHYLGLIMTEVAEAVEADRKGKRVADEAYRSQFIGHNTWYQNFIKGTIEEEFAYIVIRLLDMAYAMYGESMSWEMWPGVIPCPRKYYSFVENAWKLVSLSLDKDPKDICSSIDYVYRWAEILDIDLDQHIEWKMRYNALREYKHGGKKY